MDGLDVQPVGQRMWRAQSEEGANTDARPAERPVGRILLTETLRSVGSDNAGGTGCVQWLFDDLLRIVVDYALPGHLMYALGVNKKHTRCFAPMTGVHYLVCIDETQSDVGGHALAWNLPLPPELKPDSNEYVMTVFVHDKLFLLSSFTGTLFAVNIRVPHGTMPEIKQLRPPPFSKIKYPSVTASGDEIIVCGGSHQKEFTRRVFRYHVSRGTWSFDDANELPDGICGHTLTFVPARAKAAGPTAASRKRKRDRMEESETSDEYILVGGYRTDDTMNKCGRLQRNLPWRWKSVPPLNVGRQFHCAAIHQNHLVVAGGRTAPNALDFLGVNVVEALDLSHPETGWRQLVHLPEFDWRSNLAQWTLITANGRLLAVPHRLYGEEHFEQLPMLSIDIASSAFTTLKSISLAESFIHADSIISIPLV